MLCCGFPKLAGLCKSYEDIPSYRILRHFVPEAMGLRLFGRGKSDRLREVRAEGEVPEPSRMFLISAVPIDKSIGVQPQSVRRAVRARVPSERRRSKLGIAASHGARFFSRESLAIEGFESKAVQAIGTEHYTVVGAVHGAFNS
jgi:hypothetical protein